MKNNINLSEIKTARRDAVRSFSNNAYTITSQVLSSICKSDNPEAEAAIDNCREYDFRSKNNSLAKSDVQSHIDDVRKKLEAVGYVGDVDVYYDERVICYESLTERNKTLSGEWHCEPIDEEEVSVVVATFTVGKVEEKAEEKVEEKAETFSGTREEFLVAATEILNEQVFKPAGYPLELNKVKLTCGFPSVKGTGARKRRIGECWPRCASDAGVNEIFISPVLKKEIAVLGTLAHELVHAYDDCKNGHNKTFAQIASAVGLVGKPTQCGCEEGTPLHQEIEKIVEKIGAYPHATLNVIGKKKQTTRMIKVECDCGFKVRLSQKAIDAIDEEHFCCWHCGDKDLQIG